MNAEFLFDSLEHLDAGLIEEAETAPRRKTPWFALAAAACVCLIVGFLALRQPSAPVVPSTPAEPSAPVETTPGVQSWSESLSAADYFKNNAQPEGPTAAPAEASLVMPPWAAVRSLDGERAALEAVGVLPDMPDHPEQSFQAQYSGDGSLYKVVFLWMRRTAGSLEGYSDLCLTAAPAERHEVSDVITDVETPVTVTERDGIQITAAGCDGQEKTLTWQTDGGWYQVSGCWNDSMEDVVALLDWFWMHPLDLAQFTPPPEEVLREADPADWPDAFANAIPDFAALGYETESERLTLSGDAPVWFEGVYTRGETRIRWTVDTGADADDFGAANLGRPRKFMQALVTEALKDRDYVNLFIDTGDRPLLATLRLESGTPDDAAELIDSLAGE